MRDMWEKFIISREALIVLGTSFKDTDLNEFLRELDFEMNPLQLPTMRCPPMSSPPPSWEEIEAASYDGGPPPAPPGATFGDFVSPFFAELLDGEL